MFSANPKLTGLAFFILLCSSAFSQRIVFTNQHGTFKDSIALRLTLQADHQKPIEFTTGNAETDLSGFSFDSIVTLFVNGLSIHEYCNQYTPTQFKQIDTIVLYQSLKCQIMTPRFFPAMNYDLDSAVRDEAAFFGEFMHDSPLDSTFCFQLYHADPISKKELKQIQTLKASFCQKLGVDEQTIQLIDTKQPYATAYFNFFNPETVISREFINLQNTPWMKTKATEYSVALVLNVIWKQQ